MADGFREALSVYRVGEKVGEGVPFHVAVGRYSLLDQDVLQATQISSSFQG